jgi:hypothetical protein
MTVVSSRGCLGLQEHVRQPDGFARLKLRPLAGGRADCVRRSGAGIADQGYKVAVAAGSPSCGDLMPEGCSRVAQSLILGLESRSLTLQSLHSAAQLGVLLALRCDLLLLFLN